MHSFLPTNLGGTFFPLMGVYGRNFFSGGGVHVHPVHPLAYAPDNNDDNKSLFPQSSIHYKSIRYYSKTIIVVGHLK